MMIANKIVHESAHPRTTRRDITILTGPGKLHLFEAARALADLGWHIRVVTGWLPDNKSVAWLDPLGRLLGQPNLRQRVAGRRTSLAGLAHAEQCTAAEFGQQALGFLTRFGLLDEGRSGALGFKLFGRAACSRLGMPDIIHVRSGAGQGGAIRKARSSGAHVVVDHSIAHPDTMETALAPEYQRYGLVCPINSRSDFWKVVLQDCEEADTLLVNSDYVRQTFESNGYPASRQEVAYLGVSREFWGVKSDYESKGPIKLLFTGHFDLRKGARVLVDAGNILRKRGVKFHLKLMGFVGSGQYALRNATFAEDMEVLKFTPRPVLIEHMKSADIFVFPTFAEGSSRSAMEAMAAGLPVITTTACGVPIEDGVNGLYVTAGDAERLADAIEQLANDPARRMFLGANARDTISRSYSWETYGRTVSAVYDRLLAQR